MHLFGRTTSINVQRVLWTLHELEIPYERTDLGGGFGGLTTDDYTTMNPNQRVPTLIDGDLTLWESNSIVRYLVATYGAGNFVGNTAADHAQADMWMEWFQNNCYTHFIELFYQTVRLPHPKRSPSKRDHAIAALTQSFGILDDHLSVNEFVVGSALSMGDFIIGASLFRYFSMEFKRPPLRNLAAYYERLTHRGAYRENVMTSYESLRATNS